MEVSIGVNQDEHFESLWDWLRNEPDLRGRTRLDQRPAAVGNMGGSAEIVVALASGGTATALIRALTTWIAQRRADVTIKVTSGPQGNTVSVSAKRVADPETLLRTVIDLNGPGKPETDSSAAN